MMGINMCCVYSVCSLEKIVTNEQERISKIKTSSLRFPRGCQANGDYYLVLTGHANTGCLHFSLSYLTNSNWLRKLGVTAKRLQVRLLFASRLWGPEVPLVVAF